MELFLNVLLRLFCLMPIIGLAKPFLENNYRKYLVIFCFLFFFDTVLFGSLLFDGQNWNWFGNIARLFWTLTFIYTTKLLTKQEIGWTFHISDQKAVPIIVSAFIFLRLILRLIFQGLKGGYNLETFFYELTLPGITEEILFRGIFLGLLNKVYSQKRTFINTNFGWD